MHQRRQIETEYKFSYKQICYTQCYCGFGYSLVWQVFFMMLFAEIMNVLGITEYLGFWLISRNFCVGRPWVFAFLIFTAAWILGGLTLQKAAASQCQKLK